jgi:hypothetical protein
MANAPQKESVATRVPEIFQCPGCPPRNSLPEAPGSDGRCGDHAWWNAHNYS